MKELKVGERVTITLEVVENTSGSGSCTGCFFDVSNKRCYATLLGFECMPKYRSDNKDVIFKEVNE